MPALLRSLNRTSLKFRSSSALAASVDEDLKSGTAILTFSTPRPVPVRIQSCCAESCRARKQNKIANIFLKIIDLLFISFQELPLIVEPKLHANFVSRIIIG